MKLVRYGNAGQEKPGLLDAQGQLRDLSGVISDIGPDQLGDAALERLRQLDTAALPLVQGAPRLGTPVGGIGKFVAIGLNFADHAAESGLPVPAEPILFMKATSCIQGPNDAVMLPRGSVKTDWEVELGVVIGQRARYVSEFMTLEPGDVLTTGTPPGVGMGRKPPLFLKPGDQMRLGIAGLGEQHQGVVPFSR